MKFSYRKTPSDDPSQRWFSRPIIDVTVSGDKSTTVAALVDSGADISLFNVEVAEYIGLDVEKGRIVYVGGVGEGRLKAYLHKVKLQVEGIEKAVEVPIAFTENLGVSGILGQEGFFDTHRIKFEKDHDTFEITPVKK